MSCSEQEAQARNQSKCTASDLKNKKIEIDGFNLLILLGISEEHQFNWDAELVFDPDKVLVKSSNIIISSDGWILDHAAQWFNLGALLIEQHIKESNVIES